MDGKRTTEGTDDTEEELRNKERTSIGLTGPMSKYASPPQLVKNVPYTNLENMQAFARRAARAVVHDGQAAGVLLADEARDARGRRRAR